MKTEIKQKRKDGLKRQNELMAIALELFATQGYHATSISDILEKAVIARGTFYLHFKSKSEILEMILDSFLQKMAEEFLKLDISADRPMEEIKKMYVDTAITFAAMDEFKNFITLFLRDSIALSEEVQVKVNSFYKVILDMSTTYIKKAQEEGKVLDSIDPYTNSIIIVGSIKEIVYRWAVLNDDFDILQAINTTVEVFFRGMVVK